MAEFPPYHKIDSIFKRDKTTNRFIIGDWARGELEFLQDCLWDWTEKVDGTNIRIKLELDPDTTVDAEYRGRTDNAQFSKAHAAQLDALIRDTGFHDRAHSTFVESQAATEPVTVILYGEGYGAGIQKGGAYRPDPGFILFDVLIDNQWWMPTDAVRQIGGDLGLDVVPFYRRMTIADAIEVVETPSAFKSAWPDVQPEGLVGVPAVPLFDRRHRRIITKVKVRDFE